MDQNLSRRGMLGFAGVAATAVAVPARGYTARPPVAKLFYTEEGRGRNVMLLHGWTADSHDWSWQLPVLENRYRTVCVDLRGHGRSEILPPGCYLPADYVRDIEALIEGKYHGAKFVVVGHSMGGQIATRLAAKRPDLVEAIVSVDGTLGFAAGLTPVFQEVTQNLATGDPGVVISAFFEKFYDPVTPRAFKRWHARRVQGMPAHVVRETVGPLFLGADQVGVGRQSEIFCRKLAVPVYHLCRDTIQADRMRPWFSKPKSKVDVWRNSGHWIMQDRADDVNGTITSWIDNL